MPHFRVDDAFHAHPKAQRVGDEAIGLWTRAGSYCMAYLTDGFVPEWWVKQQPKGTAKAKKLVAVGLWIDGQERDGEKGYQFHEFLGPGRQDSREKIEADRELARKRKQKSRRESQQESRQESQRDTPRDGRGESRRSPGYTQPNPTQPISNETLGGEGPEANAHDPGPPPDHCPRHPGGTDRPCRACGDAREHHAAWESGRLAAGEARRRAFLADLDACPDCDIHGWALDDDGTPAEPARRCPNHDWETTHA
ncbi:MAG: hypothetical protein M3Y90_15580 [Actinomycetota bacterium]|nr:hypothetical protein [Actinomycetota bacterium]